MNKILLAQALIAMLCITFIGCSSKQLSSVESTPTEARKNISTSARDLGARVANWQVEKIKKDDYSYLAERYHNASSNPIGWIQATFYIGLSQWAETVNDTSLRDHMEAVAKKEEYRLRLNRGNPPNDDSGSRHADDHAIGQMYLWITEQTGNTAAYGPTKKLFDEILANPSTVSLDMKQPGPKRWAFESPCQDRWCWADALFMAPRTWLKLGNILNDPRYFEFADREFWATVDYLFSEEHGLFFRDSHYFDLKSDNGEPVFWSRGNGWVFAALPLIIDDLPENHPSRDRYIELYKKNAAGLARIQTPSGYWSASLLDPDKVKTPEVSGTGFITYGLAWGVNKGILKDARYAEVVKKGWRALERAVQPNGRVNWVQQVGKSPDPVSKHETQLYGVGAVLLAASEMTKWDENKHNYIAIEAENYASQYLDDIRRWFVFNAKSPQHTMADSDTNHATEASNGSYIELLPDTRTNHSETLVRGENFTNVPGRMAVLSYPVFFHVPGKYYAWARAYSTGPEDNGLHIGLNNTWPKSGQRLQLCQGKHQWTWSSAQRTKENHCGTPKTISLDIPSRGVHNVMISMREDGFELDKLLLTTNADYTPIGKELPQSQTETSLLPEKEQFLSIYKYKKILNAAKHFEIHPSGGENVLINEDNNYVAITAPNKSTVLASHILGRRYAGEHRLTLVTLSGTDNAEYKIIVNDRVVASMTPQNSDMLEQERYFQTEKVSLNEGDVIQVSIQIKDNDAEKHGNAFMTKWRALVVGT